jgi:hypothetical protein
MNEISTLLNPAHGKLTTEFSEFNELTKKELIILILKTSLREINKAILFGIIFISTFTIVLEYLLSL